MANFLPDHEDFFQEIYADSDSEEEFEGFEEQEEVFPLEQREEHETDPFESWEEGERIEPVYDFTSESGLVNPLVDSDLSEPATYFFLLFPLELTHFIASETNRYAEQVIRSRGELRRFSRFRNWTPTTGFEILKLIAMVLAMGIVTQQNVTDYWSQDPISKTPFFPATMSRDRFQLLISFLHINNNDHYIAQGEDGHDPLFKVGPVYHKIINNFSKVYNPHQFLSIDEGMVPWKGNLSFRVYSPDKPIKYGLKAYMLCDSVNGFCLRFKLYTGRRTTPPSEHGATYDTVLDLVRDRMGKGHIVFMDNYYSSPVLFLHLWSIGIAAVGTVRSNRRGLPIELKEKVLRNQGDTYVMHTGPLSAIKYLDKKPVILLSTLYTSENVRTRHRTQEIFHRPKVVVKYDKYMGGVDRSDQMVANSKVDLKTLKWWKKVFFHVLSVAVLNSYIMYKENVPKPVSFRVFRKKLIAQLVGIASQTEGRQPAAPGRPKSQQLERLTGRHFPSRIPGLNAKSCVVCNSAMRQINTAAGIKRRRPGHMSRIGCADCGVALCIEPCFQLYHTKQDYLLAYKRTRTEE